MTETPNQQQTPQYPSPGYYYPMPQNSDDEIDLRELSAVIWQGKWWIIAITFLFAVGSVFYALHLPNIYKSEALLAPAARDQQSGGLSSLAGQFGGMASLAGIHLSGTSTNKTTLALQVLQSREFIGHFIQNHHLLVPLMASKGWDKTTNQLKINTKLYNPQTGQWLTKKGKSLKPTLQKAEGYFNKKILTAVQDKTTGMVTVAVSFYSPVMAQQWASWLVHDLNAEMRQQDMIGAQNSIHYLNTQIAKTSLADNRTMLYQLIEQQTKTLMLTKVRKEYVFKTIDPPIVPEKKAEPKRALICVLGTLLGLILAIMVVLIPHFTRKPQ